MPLIVNLFLFFLKKQQSFGYILLAFIHSEFYSFDDVSLTHLLVQGCQYHSYFFDQNEIYRAQEYKFFSVEP